MYIWFNYSAEPAQTGRDADVQTKPCITVRSDYEFYISRTLAYSGTQERYVGQS